MMEIEEERQTVELQANEFGICRDQLFCKEHPRGMPVGKVRRVWLIPTIERSDTIFNIRVYFIIFKWTDTSFMFK